MKNRKILLRVMLVLVIVLIPALKAYSAENKGAFAVSGKNSTRMSQPDSASQQTQIIQHDLRKTNDKSLYRKESADKRNPYGINDDGPK